MITKEIPTLEELFGEQISCIDALNQLMKFPKAYEKFRSFPLEFQEQILEFLQGIRGLPILYDCFFKTQKHYYK